MIKDLQEFGKWLNDNHQVEFGKDVNDDDYIFIVNFNDGKFSLDSIFLKENAPLNYFNFSCFNEDLLYPPNQNIFIPSQSDLVGFSPFLIKLNHDFEKSNKLNKDKIDKFKNKIKRSLKSVKNNKSFVEVSNLYFDDLENFINVCDLNEDQVRNITILNEKFSSEYISDLIIKYYTFLLDYSDDIIEKIINFKHSDDYTNKKGNFYLACIFGDYHDLINDFFYLYCNFLKTRSKKIKDYKKGCCSICGSEGITNPSVTYFNLDMGSFNRSPNMKNSKLRLCKNCDLFINYAIDKLGKIIKNNNLLLIPKIKYGSYNDFLKISNKDINSFEKINHFLKNCTNFNFDLIIIDVDTGKSKLITIKKYIENYQAYLVYFENLYLYSNKSMNYLFNEKLNISNEEEKYRLNNTFSFEGIFKEFFNEINDGKVIYPNFNHFYEIYTKDLTGSKGIFKNFSSNTISIFSKYRESIFSFIYEVNLDALNKSMINEIILNSVLIFQKNNFGGNFSKSILKRLNYYFMFKKEFLEDNMLSDENMINVKKNFGKHKYEDDKDKVIFDEHEKNYILELIEDDPAIKYYLIGQFISYIDIRKSADNKNKDIFSNYITNINRNNIKKLFVTEILQKNNFYMEKMSNKAKFIFEMLERNMDTLFNEGNFSYEDYLLLLFTGYYTNNILLNKYNFEEE